MKKLTAIMALCLMACLLFAASALSEAVSRNPLLTPPVLENYIETPDELLNILILSRYKPCIFNFFKLVSAQRNLPILLIFINA